MGFKQYISRTWQMIEQQVNDVPFRPHVISASSILERVQKIECLNMKKKAWEVLTVRS